MFLTSSAAAAAATAAGMVVATPDALAAESPLVVNVATKGIEGGNTDQSTAIQKVITEVNEAGGGIVYFPLSGTEHYYRMKEVNIPANVWLWRQ
jgi:polygalacturonase